MSQYFFGDSLEAGNASYTTMFTMPAGSTGFVSNISAYNSTGGPLTLTLAVVRQAGTTARVIAVESISTVSTSSYSGGSTRRVTPLVLQPGELLQAQGSGAGIWVTFSGLRITS